MGWITTAVQSLGHALKRFVRQRFMEGAERSIKAKQNIVGLLILRGLSVGINFILVPLTISYLTTAKYGVWVTLSSVLGWVSVMDVGLGNGMRNKFAEAVALGRADLARTYISTTYAFVMLTAAALVLLFLILNPFLNWSVLLNTSPVLAGEISDLAAAVFIFFCARLVFGLIGTLLIADQKPVLNSLLDVSSSLLSLLFVLILRINNAGSLYWLGFSVSAAMVISPLVATFWLFGRKYQQFRPSAGFVDFQAGKELLRLGVQFFVLQMAGIFLFAGSNVVISQLFTPEDVIPYNIAYRYYGATSLVFTILLTPFWSAYTDAYFRKDIAWILMTLRKLRMAWYVLVVVVVLMTPLASWVYRIWVGPDIHVPLPMSVCLGLYVLIYTWCSIYINLINGTGKIRLQLIAGTLGASLTIPLSIAFVRILHMGPVAVVVATCVCFLPLCVLWPVQASRLIKGTARGIWAK